MCVTTHGSNKQNLSELPLGLVETNKHNRFKLVYLLLKLLVLREYFASYLWLLQVSEYFQQWTMWRPSLETRWVINILEWFFYHIYWARDFFCCVSDEDVIKSFQELRNGLWRFSLRISCKPVMKTYNLFHLYIVTTILLLLVIELYHYVILLVLMTYITLGPVRLEEFWRNLDGLEECWRNLWEKNTVLDEKKEADQAEFKGTRTGKTS